MIFHSLFFLSSTKKSASLDALKIFSKLFSNSINIFNFNQFNQIYLSKLL